MILVTHALIGAAIGKTFTNPFKIVALSLISHYAFDHLRHGEYLDKSKTFRKNYWRVSLDLLAAFVIVFFYLYSHQEDTAMNYRIFLGVFFSMFPDLVTLLYGITKNKFLGKIYAFHGWIHKYPEFSPQREWNLRNGINDFALSLIALAIIFLF